MSNQAPGDGSGALSVWGVRQLSWCLLASWPPSAPTPYWLCSVSINTVSQPPVLPALRTERVYLPACLSVCMSHSIPRPAWLFSLYFSSVCFRTPIIGNKKDKALSPVQWGSCNRKSTKVHNCEIFFLQGQESLAAQPVNVLVRTLSFQTNTTGAIRTWSITPTTHIFPRHYTHTYRSYWVQF